MEMEFDLLIAGGTVVTGEGIRRADVGVRGEKIVAVGPDLAPAHTKQAIDASGCYVLPGAIDVHVHHLREKLSEAGGDPAAIATVRGAGYRLAA